MTRILPSVRLALATTVVGLSALAFLGTSGGLNEGPAGAAAGTALPAGWELCIMQGVGAPATQANVDDLDAWQRAEGGSTNNTAAYNPFNTRRTTDANNAPLPETMTSNGFPTFANWTGGCAATVATLIQPNMWSITAALRSGNVAPPGAFLASVDQSQWCAPGPDGTPCYENAILGVAGNIATAMLTASSALDVYGNVKNDVHAYQFSVLAVSGAQGGLGAANLNLAAALAAAQAAQTTLAAASQALRRFAVDEYVNSGLYVSTSLPTGSNQHTAPTPFGPQDTNGVVAHQYESIAAGDLVNRDQAALAAFKAARHHVSDTSKAVADALATLTADSTAQTRALAKLVADVSTMQTAGACTTVTLTSAPLPPVPGTTPAAGPDSGSVATTTTTTPSAPTTSTTTTTLITATGPAIDPTPPTSPTTSSTTTSTSTTTTTTTTAPPSTTTTTTAPPGPAPTAPVAAPPPPVSADPAGFSTLQGCVAALAPPAPATS